MVSMMFPLSLLVRLHRIEIMSQRALEVGHRSNKWSMVPKLSWPRGHLEGPTNPLFSRFSHVRMCRSLSIHKKVATLGHNFANNIVF